MKIIAIVGLTGSGKSETAKVIETKGYTKIRFGDITDEEIHQRGLELNEKNEKFVREKLRDELGMGAYAIKNIPKIDKAVEEGKQIVIDGLYSWEEYLELKKKYGDDIIILAVYAPPKERYKRLGVRNIRPLTKEEGQSRDIAEIENINKAGPISMADYTILNTETLKELDEKTIKFLESEN
ncbi:AAA family ATPase [archaeon]|jgi:dephospho-CoA kinase|nr:AAA family ATPase [archaeon]MBT4352069.1 AAA family ATPase [archaeon]MBT4647180.1 AAA family ATPase [archaeon]MBT6822183.1 AAA family ATPase [archaeon]MBT7391742.1 AAA family ATPase [archaeon]